MARLEIARATLRVESWARLASAFVAVGWVGVVPAAVGLILGASSSNPAALLLCAPSALFFGAAAVLRSRAPLGTGAVTVERGRVTLEGDRTVSFAIADVASGVRTVENEGVRLELKDRRVVVVRALAPADVDALLDATGTSVVQRAVPIQLRGTVGPVVTGIVVAFVSAFVFGMVSAFAERLGGSFRLTSRALVIGVAFVFAATVSVAMALRPRLVIGIDGLRIRRRFTERFIPYERILDVAVRVGPTHSFAVATDDRGVVDLPVKGMDRDAVQRAKKRIDEAMAARAASAAGRVDAFARGNRSISAWREDLHRALSGDADYRRARLTTAAAETVLSDVSAPLEMRVGAAIALRAVEGDGARPRLRIAASASADAASTRAFEAVADEEDQALEEVLADSAVR